MNFLHLDLWVDGVHLLRNAANAGSPNSAHAYNMPQLFYQEMLPRGTRFRPTMRVKKLARDSFLFTVCLPQDVVLERVLTCEASRIIIQDRVIGNPHWGVAFNGVIEEGKQTMTALLGNACMMHFNNLRHISIAEMKHGNGDTGAVSRQLVAMPLDADKSIVTVITLR